jgi:hypothetical protein
VTAPPAERRADRDPGVRGGLLVGPDPGALLAVHQSGELRVVKYSAEQT